jgi:predicted nucleotide-binding protein
MRSFLQALGLVPILWEDAIEETGEGSPHNLDAVTAAMALAQAVVVLFTPDDEARLMPQFSDGDPGEGELRGQPRPNVLIEAGMAIALGANGPSWPDWERSARLRISTASTPSI